MKRGLTLILISITIMTVALSGIPGHRPEAAGADLPAGLAALAAAKISFRHDAEVFDSAVKRLCMAVSKPGTGDKKRNAMAALQDCRLRYKRIESFLSWFFPEVARGINGPPVCEGEEPFMEFREPTGLQVIETLLTQTSQPSRQKLLQQTDLLAQTSFALPSLMFRFEGTAAGLMQSIRLGSIRVITLGITGYDAPSLKTGLSESAVVCDEFQEILSYFPGAEKLARLASDMAARLMAAGDFDRFDRSRFLTGTVIPFQRELKSYCEAHQIILPGAGLLREGATDIFSRNALQPAGSFPSATALLVLGRRWFNDSSLSRGNKKNCGSCHNPGSAFTDGMPVSAGLNPLKPLRRNTPSLLYSAYQYRLFWDGRATGLESQIDSVLHDPLEMNPDTAEVLKCWNRDSTYGNMIAAAFPVAPRPSLSKMIGTAVGAYINTLAPFNSAFDLYMQGDSAAMSSSAKNGFNLFMGKARCGTCHFAPLFNGTLPPGFDRTEFEILGTTESTDFNRPVLSKDEGRYSVYPLPFNRYSFKTPTIRNAARTAPYMHNGRFKTLDQVLTFYNDGGGSGMGLTVPGQTLAADSLHLRQPEINDLIAFISALTDKQQGVKQ